MKLITDKDTNEAIISRINNLTESSTPEWGKMSVSQMLRHLTMWEEMALNKTLYKQSFIGKIFGKVALTDMMKDEPAKRNLPTVPGFVTPGDTDVELEKQKLTALLNEHQLYINKGFKHPFFGDLTAEQAGFIAWKHADHHLRQFGV